MPKPSSTLGYLFRKNNQQILLLCSQLTPYIILALYCIIYFYFTSLSTSSSPSSSSASAVENRACGVLLLFPLTFTRVTMYLCFVNYFYFSSPHTFLKILIVVSLVHIELHVHFNTYYFLWHFNHFSPTINKYMQ
jgi:hypothetical protein